MTQLAPLIGLVDDSEDTGSPWIASSGRRGIEPFTSCRPMRFWTLNETVSPIV